MVAAGRPSRRCPADRLESPHDSLGRRRRGHGIHGRGRARAPARGVPRAARVGRHRHRGRGRRGPAGRGRAQAGCTACTRASRGRGCRPTPHRRRARSRSSAARSFAPAGTRMRSRRSWPRPSTTRSPIISGSRTSGSTSSSAAVTEARTALRPWVDARRDPPWPSPVERDAARRHDHRAKPRRGAYPALRPSIRPLPREACGR